MNINRPILEPDLGLAFLHTQQLADILAPRGGRVSVHGKIPLQMDKLFWSHPCPLLFLFVGLGRPLDALRLILIFRTVAFRDL
jgi:hypothetical protein